MFTNINPSSPLKHDFNMLGWCNANGRAAGNR